MHQLHYCQRLPTIGNCIENSQFFSFMFWAMRCVWSGKWWRPIAIIGGELNILYYTFAIEPTKFSTFEDLLDVYHLLSE